MERVAAAGLSIVMHVHDEIVVDCPKGHVDGAFGYIEMAMSTPPHWAPGLVLKGDGYTTEYYRKD